MEKKSLDKIRLDWDEINYVFKQDEENDQKGEKRDSERYKLDSKILNEKIDANKLSLENTDEKLEYIYYISTLINSFYSTRMGATRVYQVAKEINKKGPIKIDDIEKIIEIINGTSISYENSDKEKHYRPYSFLSKFFSLHCDRNLPLYDSRIENTIKLIIKCAKEPHTELYSPNFINQITNYKNTDLKDYEKFKEIVDLIREEIGTNPKNNDEKISYDKLDKYFWVLWEDKINIE